MTVKEKIPATTSNGVLHAPAKLDVACGQNKQKGFKGIDIAGDADILWDLNEIPWPIKTSSVKEVFCSHYVEHIPHERPEWGGKDGFFRFADELWRVMKNEATAEIIHPFSRSDRAFWDPTHTRYLNDMTWHYLNPEWREANRLDHYQVECNFEIVTLNLLGLADDYLARNHEQQSFARTHYWNVIGDLGIIIKARK